MAHALQVSFRQLIPSEGLIELAAERYRQLRRVRPDLGECCVSLEMGHGSVAHAIVLVREEGRPGTEAKASHRDPMVALGLALESAQAQLGVRVWVEPPKSTLRTGQAPQSPRRVRTRTLHTA
jgi:hypothetical protein